MILRKSYERGHANLGWLNSKFTFSFADYFDPNHMGFKHLRVINEDYIQPQQGFGMHPHRNMEIVTYLIKGQLEHTDDQNNKARINPGEIQKMSAGSGIYHSEFNPGREDTHLLQIWILPNRQNIKPGYQQKMIPHQKNSLNLIISPDARLGSLSIQQDINIYASHTTENHELTHTADEPKNFWVQLISGNIEVNKFKMQEGDGLALENTHNINIMSLKDSHFLTFEM